MPPAATGRFSPRVDIPRANVHANDVRPDRFARLDFARRDSPRGPIFADGRKAQRRDSDDATVTIMTVTT